MFSYFFNAVFYCMHIQHYRLHLKSVEYSARFKAFLWETFTSKKPDFEYHESQKRYLEVKLRAMKMGRADDSVESDFRTVIGLGSFFLFFLSMLFAVSLGRNALPLPIVGYLLAAPMFISYYMICALVFQKQRYKVYFREFRKKDELWIRKWLKITTFFEIICFIGPVILAIVLF